MPDVAKNCKTKLLEYKILQMFMNVQRLVCHKTVCRDNCY